MEHRPSRCDRLKQDERKLEALRHHTAGSHRARRHVAGDGAYEIDRELIEVTPEGAGDSDQDQLDCREHVKEVGSDGVQTAKPRRGDGLELGQYVLKNAEFSRWHVLPPR